MGNKEQKYNLRKDLENIDYMTKKGKYSGQKNDFFKRNPKPYNRHLSRMTIEYLHGVKPKKYEGGYHEETEEEFMKGIKDLAKYITHNSHNLKITSNSEPFTAEEAIRKLQERDE